MIYFACKIDYNKIRRKDGQTTMATYAVGDIHGCFDEWLELKNRIESEDADAQFILVGDIVDRGPKVYDMLMWAIENISETGKYQMVIGNHEEEKLKWLNSYFNQVEWAEESGDKFNLINMPSDNYDFQSMCLDRGLNDKQLMKIRDWFNNLAYYKELYINMEKGKQRFIIVHADLPYDCVNKDGSFKKRSINKKTTDAIERLRLIKKREKIVWNRNNYGNNVTTHTIVVHGHTPTILRECVNFGARSGMIWFNHKDINIDCGAVYKLTCGNEFPEGNLAALRLEDLKEYYLFNDFLMEHGDTEKSEISEMLRRCPDSRLLKKKKLDNDFVNVYWL
jgi:hypothetical protein